ncbi:hypothetical protein [Dyadobacter beijingensis]|nr:hypothetical protein [Dyadobacter beijingensis]
MSRRIRGVRKKVIQAHSHKMHKKNSPKQDTFKEDYLFCSTCEYYFGALERHFSLYVQPYVERAVASEDFYLLETMVSNGNHLEINGRAYVCHKAQPLMMQLLIESIVLRIHVSSKDPYEQYKFPDQLITQLRSNLMKFRSISIADVFTSCRDYQGDPIPPTYYFLFCPIMKVLPKDQSIVTEFVEPTERFFKILAGEYHIWIDTHFPPHPFLNYSPTPVKIIPLSEERYLAMNQHMFDVFFENMNRYMEESGNGFYDPKKNTPTPVDENNASM